MIFLEKGTEHRLELWCWC